MAGLHYDSVYNYDREILAKYLRRSEEYLDQLLVYNRIYRDTTYRTLFKAGKNVFLAGSALGIVLNLFCIFLMASMKRPLKTSIKLLLTLSISDAVRSSLDVVYYFFNYNNARFIGIQSLTTHDKSTSRVYLRRTLSSINLLTDISGSLTTVMLAVVIFLAVKKPMAYNAIMSNRHSTGMTLFIWTTSVSLVICFNIILQEMINDPGSVGSLEQEGIAYYVLFIIYRYMVMGIFCIIALLNIAIYIMVRINTMKSRNPRRRRRFILILVLITTCFFITNLPLLVQSYVINMDLKNNEIYVNKPLFYASNCMPYFVTGWRSFGNSIVYTVRLPEIRQQVSKVFCPEKVKKLQRRRTVESFILGNRSRNESQRRSRRSTYMERVDSIESTESTEVVQCYSAVSP